MNRKDLFSLGLIWIVWINRSFGRWNSWANNLNDINIKAPVPYIIVIGLVVSILLTFIIKMTQKKKGSIVSLPGSTSNNNCKYAFILFT